MSKLKIKEIDFDEKKVDRLKAMILSMTKKEREKPEIINSSRKKRIAAGSELRFRRSTSFSNSSNRQNS